MNEQSHRFTWLININKLHPLDKNLLFEHLVYSFNGDIDSVIINGKPIEQETYTNRFEEERDDLFNL